MNLTFQAAWVVIMAEVLAVLIVAVTGYWFYQRHKKNQTLNEIDRFVKKVVDHGPLKTESLAQILNATNHVDSELIEQTLQNINAAERALFQQVIQFYLEQNPNLLKKVEKQISHLSEPYYQLIEKLTQNIQQNTPAVIINETKQPERVVSQPPNHQLTQQLKYALQAIEEITDEYARVFNGRQTTLELENSSQKMLQLFREVERRLNQINLAKTEDF